MNAPKSGCTKVREGVFVPPEARPYCDSRGFIWWAVVRDEVARQLGRDPESIWPYHLKQVLFQGANDENRALPIMRAMGLDRIISIISNKDAEQYRGWHQKVIECATAFGIDISKVPGTGPDGLVLKRDIVAYRHFFKAGTANILPSPSAVVYPVADAKNLERLHSDLKASLDEQVRLLAQRRRLAGHLRGAMKKSRMMQELWEGADQMADSLREDLDRACSDRSAAITRAVAAEARSAQAERMLAQVLNAQSLPTTLFSRLWSRLISRTSEVTA